MREKVAFLGLGVMGYPMAGHLVKAGHDVTVYNRTATKADAWVEEYGGVKGETPADAARDASFVMACVGNDDDVREVTIGPKGAFQTMRKGSVFIDHTTTSAELAREICAAAQSRGIGFVDAPVSGGQDGAIKGAVNVMAGGEAETFDKADALMNAYAHASRLMGPAGAGQLTKMVNQICIAGVLQGLSEGLHFAQKAGLDPNDVVKAISSGAAQSWQMNNRAHTMVKGDFDFGFAIDWMRKDLGFCLEEAKRNGAHLPMTDIIDGYYADLQRMGGGRWDTSCLIERLEKLDT